MWVKGYGSIYQRFWLYLVDRAITFGVGVLLLGGSACSMGSGGIDFDFVVSGWVNAMQWGCFVNRQSAIGGNGIEHCSGIAGRHRSCIGVHTPRFELYNMLYSSTGSQYLIV